MPVKLTEVDEQKLRGFPVQCRDRAIKALEAGKAFCPSCNWAGHSNCAHFDECGAFIECDGERGNNLPERIKMYRANLRAGPLNFRAPVPPLNGTGSLVGSPPTGKP